MPRTQSPTAVITPDGRRVRGKSKKNREREAAEAALAAKTASEGQKGAVEPSGGARTAVDTPLPANPLEGAVTMLEGDRPLATKLEPAIPATRPEPKSGRSELVIASALSSRRRPKLGTVEPDVVAGEAEALEKTKNGVDKTATVADDSRGADSRSVGPKASRSVSGPQKRARWMSGTRRC